MEIYNGYTTDDALMNEPCIVENMGSLYPVLVKDYGLFIKNAELLMYGNQHIKGNVLQGIIVSGIAQLCNGNIGSVDYGTLEMCFNITAQTIAKIISCVARKEIKYITNFELVARNENEFFTATFYDEGYTILINDTNWEIFREIVLKQNVIQNPKVYEDPLYEKWLNKSKIAESKGKDTITIGDMMTVISCYTGKTYEVIKNQNMMQLYSDYHRINHVVNYDATTLFKTVSNNVPNVNFSCSIVDELFKDRDDDYAMDSSEISKQL